MTTLTTESASITDATPFTYRGVTFFVYAATAGRFVGYSTDTTLLRQRIMVEDSHDAAFSAMLDHIDNMKGVTTLRR